MLAAKWGYQKHAKDAKKEDWRRGLVERETRGGGPKKAVFNTSFVLEGKESLLEGE